MTLPRAPRRAAPDEGQSWHGASLCDAPAHRVPRASNHVKKHPEAPNKRGELGVPGRRTATLPFWIGWGRRVMKHDVDSEPGETALSANARRGLEIVGELGRV